MFGNGRSIKAGQCHGILIAGDNNQNINVHYGPVETSLTIPFKPNSLTGSIDSLLIWQSQLTPLIGREKTLGELEQWAKKGPRISVKLIHGEGGVGKTRLAFELAVRLRQQGWEAGQLAGLNCSSGFRLGEQGTLLVMDYPEQQPEQVRQLLEGIKALEEPTAPLRILLLSRRSALLEQMGASLRYLAAPALALASLEEERLAWQLFEAAWTRIRQLRQGEDASPPIDRAAFSQWLALHKTHRQPLFVLAYTANLFEEPSATSLSGGQIIESLVAREVERLEREGEALQLHHRLALPLLKGLAAISGGITARQLKALAEYDALTPLLPGYELLGRSTLWQPGEGDRAGRVADPQPDLLAAALLSQLLQRDDELPGEWLYAALDVSDDIEQATSRLGRLMYDATHRLALPWPRQALIEAVANDLSRCRRLDQGLSRRNLERPLLPLALSVGQRLAEVAETPQEQAHRLNNLSNSLAASGDRAAGLEAIERAVDIYEKLVKNNFAAYAPDLAASLNNLSIRLRESGDRAGGLEAIERAVDIYEKLAKENFAAYAPDLAASLNNLSIRLRESGDRADGLEAIKRAVAIREKLAEENFTAYAPDLARSLNNLSNHLAASGNRAGGLKTIERAVDICEKLAAENFAAYAPDLATSLNNLSNRLAASGDRVGGLEAIKRAVDIYEKLAEENFAAYAPDLARSLAILSVRLAENGDCAGGLGAIERAVDIYEKLAKENFTAYAPDLAGSLGNLANRMQEHGDMEEAITTLQRAIELITPFATDGTTYGDWLAKMKSNLARYLARRGE